MGFQHIENYFSFVKIHSREYLTFNKQLVLAELAGLIAGLIIAEIFRSLSNVNNSLYSGVADYSFQSYFSLLYIITITEKIIYSIVYLIA